MSNQMSDETSKRLDAAGERVFAEMVRTDNKASFLLAVDAGLVAGLAAISPHLPAAGVVLAGMASVAMVVGAVMAVLVVRPHLGGGHGFAEWAKSENGADVLAKLTEDHRADHLLVMSRTAARKMRLLRKTANTTILALALVAAAGVTSGFAD